MPLECAARPAQRNPPLQEFLPATTRFLMVNIPHPFDSNRYAPPRIPAPAIYQRTKCQGTRQYENKMLSLVSIKRAPAESNSCAYHPRSRGVPALRLPPAGVSSESGFGWHPPLLGGAALETK